MTNKAQAGHQRFSWKKLPALFQETYTAWNEDGAPRLGAALAYYTVFSLAPMLVVLIGLAALWFGEAAARGQIVEQVEGTIGKTAGRAVQEMLQNAHGSGEGGSLLATLIGFATVLLGAGALFGQLQEALNIIWGVKAKEGLGLWFVVRTRFVSFAMVLGVGFLLLVSLVISALIAGLSEWLQSSLGNVAWLAPVLNIGLSFLIVSTLFMAMFKILPDAEIEWRDVAVGGLVTGFLFTLGKWGLGLYLGRPGVESAYGSAGALVVLLLWVYYAAQILFFGAEFTKVFANKYGSRIVPSPFAEASTEQCQAGTSSPVLDQNNKSSSSPVVAPVPAGSTASGSPAGVWNNSTGMASPVAGSRTAARDSRQGEPASRTQLVGTLVGVGLMFGISWLKNRRH